MNNNKIRSRGLYVECSGRNDIHCKYPDDRDTDIFTRDTLCSLNPDGTSFGDITDASQATPLMFIYQIQTTATVNPSTLQDEALPAVESSITEGLLAELFNCASSPSERKLQQENNSLVGISSDPVDQLLAGTEAFQCRTSLVEGAERCYLIGGNLTLYGAFVARTSAWEATNRSIDTIPSYPPGVVDVKFVEAVEDPNDPRFKTPTTDRGTGGPDSIQAGSESDRIQAWPLVLIGAGLITLVVGVFLTRRFKKQRDGDFEIVTATSGEYPRPWHEVESAYMQEEALAAPSLSPGQAPDPANRSPFHSPDEELDDIFEDSDDGSTDLSEDVYFS